MCRFRLAAEGRVVGRTLSSGFGFFRRKSCTWAVRLETFKRGDHLTAGGWHRFDDGKKNWGGAAPAMIPLTGSFEGPASCGGNKKKKKKKGKKRTSCLKNGESSKADRRCVADPGVQRTTWTQQNRCLWRKARTLHIMRRRRFIKKFKGFIPGGGIGE